MSRRGRAQIFWGPERGLTLEELAVPEPKGAEVLVRVTACTLCGSDLHSYTGRRTVPTPTVLGHEIIGLVDSLGPAAPTHDHGGLPLRVGDRVTWSLIAPCGGCFYCQRALPQKCEVQVKYGHEKGIAWTGGLGEFCLLAPGTAIFRLPETLSDAAACPLSCATATIAAAVRAVGGVAQKSVLVQGAGMLGLTACALVRAAGATEVFCTDPDPLRREQAQQFGATVLSSETSDSHGVDVALELSGAPEAFVTGLSRLRLGGSYALVGAVYPAAPVSLAIETLVRRHVQLFGVHNYTADDLASALSFLTRSPERAHFESLVSAWFPLEAARDAFHYAHQPGVFRTGIQLASE